MNEFKANKSVDELKANACIESKRVKRALRPIKRDLYSIKEALYFIKGALLYISSKEEPYIP